MRRWRPASRAGFILLGLLGLLAFAALLSGCLAPAAPAPSYLNPYRPALKQVTPAEETAWASLPRYEITATLDIENLTLRGRERITFTNREQGDLTQIGFRLYPNLPQQGGDLNVISIAANGVQLDASILAGKTAVVMRCDPPLKPGQSAELDIPFSLTIPSRPDGYVLFGRSGNVISLPAFYPILAVHDHEGWHVNEIAPGYADAAFAESSFYNVWLTTEPEWVIAGTGVIVEQTRGMDGLITTHMVAGPSREFAVIASPDYQVETTEAYGTLVHSYFFNEDRTAGLTALDRAASALRVYSDAYGPYPFREMAVVEAPLQYHGMEYSTLNMLGVETYRDKRDQLSYLVIHETAHQWWYSQVGNNPQTSAWLDEGLAEYSAYTYVLMTQGREQAEALRDQRWVQSYTYARENGMDAVLQQNSSDFPSALVYEIMVYSKGALFFDALRRAVGEEMYGEILREYVERYRFQTVAPAQLFGVIQDVTHRDPTPLINEWILTKASGAE